MKKKKYIAYLRALLVFSVVPFACGSLHAAENEGLTEGMYRWFIIEAYNEACRINGGTAGLWEQEIEGKSPEEWIADTAVLYGKEYLAAEKKFDEAGLVISESDLELLEATKERYWNELGYGRYYADYGVSEEEFHNVLLYSMKTDLLYARQEDSLLESVTREQIEDYIGEHGILFEYVAVPYPSAEEEGESEQTDVEELYLTYQERIKQGETLESIAKEIYGDTSLQSIGVSSSCTSYASSALFFDSNTSLTADFWDALTEADYGEIVFFDDAGSQFNLIFRKLEFSMDWPGIDLYQSQISTRIAAETFAAELEEWAGESELQNEKELRESIGAEELLNVQEP